MSEPSTPADLTLPSSPSVPPPSPSKKQQQQQQQHSSMAPPSSSSSPRKGPFSIFPTPSKNNNSNNNGSQGPTSATSTPKRLLQQQPQSPHIRTPSVQALKAQFESGGGGGSLKRTPAIKRPSSTYRYPSVSEEMEDVHSPYEESGFGGGGGTIRQVIDDDMDMEMQESQVEQLAQGSSVVSIDEGMELSFTPKKDKKVVHFVKGFGGSQSDDDMMGGFITPEEHSNKKDYVISPLNPVTPFVKKENSTDMGGLVKDDGKMLFASPPTLEEDFTTIKQEEADELADLPDLSPSKKSVTITPTKENDSKKTIVTTPTEITLSTPGKSKYVISPIKQITPVTMSFDFNFEGEDWDKLRKQDQERCDSLPEEQKQAPFTEYPDPPKAYFPNNNDNNLKEDDEEIGDLTPEEKTMLHTQFPDPPVREMVTMHYNKEEEEDNDDNVPAKPNDPKTPSASAKKSKTKKKGKQAEEAINVIISRTPQKEGDDTFYVYECVMKEDGKIHKLTEKEVARLSPKVFKEWKKLQYD